MKHIRHTLTLLLFMGIAATGAAQVQVSLTVSSNPSPRISDWADRTEVAILTVTNTSPELEGTPYKIRMRLLFDGALVAETHMPSVSQRSFILGSEVFLADEVMPYEAIRLYGGHETTVMQTGMLPSGHYQFCVSLLDLNNQVISTPAEVCRNMFITAYQAPELIYPVSDRPIDALSLPSTQFTWSPMTPRPPADLGLKYVVVITEVQPRQSPSQAFFVNYPLVEQEVFGTTRMLWPPEIEPPVDETQYVWGVKAVSFDDQPFLADNAGFSKIGAFTITPDAFEPKDGEQEEEDPGEEEPGEGEEEQPDEEEEEPEPGDGTLAATDTIYAGDNGEFMIIANNINANNGTFSGEGKVFVDWLNANIAVAFDSITVDMNNHLVTGHITTVTDDNAPVYPLAWATQSAANLVFTHQEVDNLTNWAETMPGQNLPYMNAVEVLQPLEMPLGFNWAGGSQLAITEMAFRADKSEFNVVAALSLPYDMGTQRLGFLARNIEFHPNEISMPMEKLELVEDFNIGNINNDIVFQFNAPDGNNLGCYIEWDDNGISEYGLQVSAQFTRDWLIPSPDNDPSQKVTASLSAQIDDWNKLILGGTMDKAEIVDAGGVTILADSVYYDFSFDLNPPGITFPENFNGDTNETFRGLYMKELAVEFPAAWQTPQGNPVGISIQNAIINHTGVTMLIEATNVLEFPDATVADLYASIDTVHVDLVNSSLVEAGIKGRIGLPISKKDDIDNPLEYTALFNNPQLPNEPVSFQLTISPAGPIPANMLKGELELAETSNIVAYFDNTQTTFDINLDGSFTWASIDLEPITNVNLALAFQGMGMQYDDNAANPLSFNIGSWAFASQQKFMADFPVTIQNIGFTTLPAQPGQWIRGTVDMDVVFNLTQEIGGMAGIGVEMALLENTQGHKFYPEYQGLLLDSIAVQANLAAVKIEGAVGIRNEDPVFGNGFIGTLDAEFKAAGINASALAEFGNTTYQNNNQIYRYWRVEADLTFPAPGVVFLPGMAFRGFGGGAYYNMEASLSGTTYSFTPLKSQLGFNASAVLATSPDEKGFNADVTLAGEFNTNTNGLTFINFTGDFWVGAELTSQSRSEAIVAGDLGVTYDFPQKHFNLFANVDVDAPPLSTPSPVGLVLDINGTSNEWFFKFGEPSNPNTVSVFGANLYAYLMFGNAIPFPSGFTPAFSNAYYNAVNQWPGTSSIGQGGVGPHTNTGSGFASGLGFMFDHESEFSLPCGWCAGDFYAGVNLGAGAELHLAFLNYAGSCAGNNPIGINGWRASGGLGFYATAGAYVRREGGLGDKTWILADLAAGAWIYGEFPNPYYAAGAISGHAYVFNIINVHFHQEFEVGTACTNDPVGSSVTVTPGDVAADQQDKLVQYIQPPNTYNFPLDAPLAVKYGLEPDEVFDAAEQQADGTILMRTFKMEKSVSLQAEQQNGSWTPVMLSQATNNLGEYLYTTLQATQGVDPGLAGPVGGITGGTGGTGSGTGAAPPHLGPSGGAVFNLINLGGVGAAPNLTGPAGGGQTGGGQPGSGPGAMPGLDMGQMPLLPYPPEPSPPNYGDLPPTPGPPVNDLNEDTNYKFTVTATLKEYVNGSWIDATTNEGDLVTETVEKSFSTGEMEAATGVGLPAESF